MGKQLKKKHSVAKITCKCGKRIKLAKLPFKTHAHCKDCKLEWHRKGNHIYSHTFTNFKVSPDAQGE